MDSRPISGKTKDSTIAERFNSCCFIDYKEQIIELLKMDLYHQCRNDANCQGEEIKENKIS
jgi:hypothetical protein